MPNNLSGTASSVITYENSLYYRIPAGYYGGLGWGSEISATYTDVASAIGLTAGKLLKGETVLGITGTGETSCPNPESQGYWKVYKFENVEATCEYCKDTSWRSVSKEVLKNCNSTSCEAADGGWFTLVEADFDFEYKEIFGYNINLICKDYKNCIRISKAKSGTGGADKTTSSIALHAGAQNNQRYGLSTSSGATYSSDSYPYVSQAGAFGVGSSCDTTASGYINNKKLGISLAMNCYSNGEHWSSLEIKGKSHYLTGYIIYR